MPEMFQISNQEQYNAFPGPLGPELAEILRFEQIQKFNNSGKHSLVIPSYDVLSLFIEDGEDFRV